MPRNRQRKRFVPVILFGLFFLIILGLLFYFLKEVPRVFTLAEVRNDGSVEVDIVEISENKVTSILVPKDTEVSLAMQRGTLRLASVARLSESENLPGQILADTLMKSFFLPIDYWALDGATDLPLAARLRLAAFRLRGFQAEKIDLSKTSFLVKTKLKDGEDGYVTTGKTPLFLTSLFADTRISSGQTAVRVVNSTGERGKFLDEIVGVFETLGAKVAPVLQSEQKDLDCVARSLDEEMLSRVASVFNCTLERTKPDSFDIELIVGKKFHSRF